MNLRPKKSLGQHFLNSPSVLAKIIESAELSPGETVLEIGPGTGILTTALLSAGAKVIAVEKDDRAIELLSEKFKGSVADGKLSLHRADILESDRASFRLEEGKYAVVANIPYYITGAILEMFLEYAPRPNRMILLVQKEVADRIVATDSRESILSISVKAFGTPKLIAKVPRGAFTPPPNVDSAILSIGNISDRRFQEKNIDTKRFFEVVKAGFAHKRKILRRNLEDALDRESIDMIWKRADLNENIRAENLALEGWFDISGVAHRISPKQG